MSGFRLTVFCVLLAAALAHGAPVWAQSDSESEATGSSPNVIEVAEPPAAQAGECWVLITAPAAFERRVERELVTPATEKSVPKPARYEWVEQTITIPAGKQRIVVKPAEYEVTEEQVLVSPAGTKTIRVPARYRTVEKKVPTQSGAVLKPNPVTGELCVVEGPVEYTIVKQQELVTPASTREIETEARYKTVKHRKLIREAETKLVDRPERTVTKRVKQMVEPASVAWEPVPAVYRDVTHLVQTAPPRNEWRSVLCQTNTTTQMLRRIQQALKDTGHDPGPVDGHWGPQSARALKRYQTAMGLPETGLNADVLKSLKLAPSGS
jgi:hypothetical protein